MTHALGAVALFLDGAAAPKKSSGSPILLILVAVGAAFYFLIYRPQQKKQRAAQTQAKSWEVGDEVVTAGGIVGRVLDITDDRVTLETSVGASFTVLRPYVLRKLEPVEPPTDVVGETDHDDEAHDQEPPPPPPPPRPAGTDDTSPGTGTSGTPGGTSGSRPVDDDEDGTSAGGSDGPPII
jgi:preprotein translocase subunit YajC